MYKNDYYAMASVMVDDPDDFAEVFFSITDVNACNKYGQTALMLAVKLDLHDISFDLINHHDIDMDKRNGNGDTAFMMSIRHKPYILTLLAFLNKPGHDLNAVDNRGRSALLLAAEFNLPSFWGESCHAPHTKLNDESRTTWFAIISQRGTGLFCHLT